MADDSNNQTIILDMDRRPDGETSPRTPVLVVVQGAEIGRRYLLGASDMTMGRHPDLAQIVIRDPSVSNEHARVHSDMDTKGFRLHDLDSRNGTFVNGCRIESIALHEGDKVFVGETVLRFSFHDEIEHDYHSRIDELMHIDSLSGLYVRRWFDLEYPKEFERVRALGQPFSVLMMDMDGLKQINDQHGHPMGSYCISEAGKIIKEALEPGGVGSRFGGDEFVAYLPGGGIEEALDLAEAIRRAIETFEFRYNDIIVAPTISIGAAELVSGIVKSDELTRLADDALYRAKKAGRNTVSD